MAQLLGAEWIEDADHTPTQVVDGLTVDLAVNIMNVRPSSFSASDSSLGVSSAPGRPARGCGCTERPRTPLRPPSPRLDAQEAHSEGLALVVVTSQEEAECYCEALRNNGARDRSRGGHACEPLTPRDGPPAYPTGSSFLSSDLDC